MRLRTRFLLTTIEPLGANSPHAGSLSLRLTTIYMLL